jgi:hypothetical protein
VILTSERLRDAALGRDTWSIIGLGAHSWSLGFFIIAQANNQKPQTTNRKPDCGRSPLSAFMFTKNPKNTDWVCLSMVECVVAVGFRPKG